MIDYKKRRKYKYTLMQDHVEQTDLAPETAIDTPYLSVSENGVLTVKKGYAWDGPSGPTFDTKTFMRGSLVHDALYQLMREQYLGQEQRKYADQLLRKICLEAGMWKVRAWWVYYGVRLGGKSSARPDLLHAP